LFATLKKELVHRRSWPAREELRREVFDYVEIFYSATKRTLRSECCRQRNTNKP
jgi:hypothetical protein